MRWFVKCSVLIKKGKENPKGRKAAVSGSLRKMELQTSGEFLSERRNGRGPQ
jgi:hypothetical protein